MRVSTWLCLGLLLVAACSDGGRSGDQTRPTSTVATAAAPDVALVELFQLLVAGDYDATEAFVDEEQLGIFSAIEVSDASVIKRFDANGLSSEARNNFWSSFVGQLPAVANGNEQVSASISRQFAVDGARFAIGTVRIDDETIGGDFVMRLVGEQWKLDPIASFGGAFVAPIRTWLRAIPSQDLATVSEMIRRHVPSWRALGQLQTDQDESGVAISAHLADLLLEIGA